MSVARVPPPETRLVLAGLGGQGVIFATRLIAQAAVRLGWPVIGSETHGMSQRGGSVVSHLKFGAAESPLIRRGTADLLLAFERNEAVRALPFLRVGGVCVVNGEASLGYDLDGPLAEASITVHALPATSMALAHGSAALINVAMVGFASGLGCLPVPEEALRAALSELAGSRREPNLLAFSAGARAAQTARPVDRGIPDGHARV
jgi:indolepyruvate ferredoxin oxidoreductase beta subunit